MMSIWWSLSFSKNLVENDVVLIICTLACFYNSFYKPWFRVIHRDILRVGLEIGVFWGFDPLNGQQSHCNPKKAPPFAEARHMTYWCKCGTKNKSRTKVKGILRNHNRWHVTCSPRPPTLPQRHVDLHVWSYPRRSYIFQVSSTSAEGFWSHWGSKFGHSHYFGCWLLQQLLQAVMHRDIWRTTHTATSAVTLDNCAMTSAAAAYTVAR